MKMIHLDEIKWADVEEELLHMASSKIPKLACRVDIPDGVKTIIRKWATKKKTSGKHIGRLNSRDYEKIEVLHYAA